MAVGYDIIVRSIGDVRKDELFVVVVTQNGIALCNKYGKVISSVLYPHMRLKVLRRFEHTPFVHVCNGDKCHTLEYKSLSEARKAYSLFKTAIKNSKIKFSEHVSRISDNTFFTPMDMDYVLFRTYMYLQSGSMEIVYVPLKHVLAVEDWARKKLDETFMEVRW